MWIDFMLHSYSTELRVLHISAFWPVAFVFGKLLIVAAKSNKLYLLSGRSIIQPRYFCVNNKHNQTGTDESY